MPVNRRVTEGECIASIADQYGFHPDTVWDYPANARLKQQRQDPNILMPGDVLVIPDKRPKEESCATENRHRFLRLGVPSKIWIVLNDDDSRPRAGIPYILDIDGRIFQGNTDASGRIRHPIPPGASRGKLVVNPGADDEEQYSLQLGYLDPISEMTGVQARLNNLGFSCGEVDGALNGQTRLALSKFQRKCQLPATGEPDPATLDRLKQEHGS